MKTNEILRHIRENGGFDNFNKWNREEVKEWVITYYQCTLYVANKVANRLI